MGHKTFIGGVHPYDGKELSKDSPIKEVLPKGDMVYPVSQHIGAPAKPVVAVGDTVLKGQMIAEAGGFVSSPIYSSVSGKVKAIEKRRVAVGDMVDSIVIENDGMFTETTYNSVEDVTALSKEEIIEKVKNAGVVGMGGAGFPTHVKLSPKEPDKIEYIIANCAECEPYLTSDYRRMLENPEELIGGMKIILQLFDNAKGILGIEDATTGRAINSKMLPADAGCIVDNVETIIAVYNAVKNGQPVLKRISTVTGDAVKNPSNILYSIGTSYQELVDAAGGFKSQPEKIISGGPMMGFAMFSLDIPTTKTSSSILCFTHDEVAAFEPQACINCGRCVEACPEQLIPSRLAKFGLRGQMDEFEKLHGLECIECGSCSFACPSRRQVAQPIKTMKKLVLAEKRKQASKK